MHSERSEYDEAASLEVWQCEQCGGEAMRHVQSLDRHGQLAWHNRCLRCGRDSEYLPTPEEIAYETAKIRAETGRVEVDDAQEKFWGEIRREQIERVLDDDDPLADLYNAPEENAPEESRPDFETSPKAGRDRHPPLR